MTLAQIMNEPGGMPYVRFERRAVEDPVATLAAGHYVAKDIDFAYITPPYSKDIFTQKVTAWFEQIKSDAINGRMPSEWVEKYKAAYAAWQNGQELPVDGIPIKGWGVCSPAQQETLIKMHILTVEQLADINHEGIMRVGMGGQDLKNKAVAWLKSLKRSGAVTLENAALKKQVDDQSATISGMESKITELSRMVEQLSQSIPMQAQAPYMGAVLGIGASELFEE